ncbi:diguanylate cyclase domain-containing protein [Parahaliea mediterranea]
MKPRRAKTLRRARADRRHLRSVLHRGHLGMALLAVTTAGLAVAIGGLLTLRTYAENNLDLIARSMTYTVEAAVVFNDPQAADEALHLIANREEVLRAEVLDRHDRVLAQWQRPNEGPLARLEERLAKALLPMQTSQPLLHEGTRIGEVRLTGSAERLADFIAFGMGGIALCLLLATAGAAYLSRRLVGQIASPLVELARVAHTVRRDRDFNRRVKPVGIVELDELGQDFNALLDELDAWQAHLQHENKSLSHKASHDSLTGLPNRTYFESRLNRSLCDARDSGEPLVVMFIDCDRFKSINDERGHAAGDAVLVEIATRLHAILRKEDLVARLGGDEFAVLLKSIDRLEHAERVADAILENMKKPIELPDGDTLNTTLSIGIALYPDHAETPEALLHGADLAMYKAKRLARGTHFVAPAPHTPARM